MEQTQYTILKESLDIIESLLDEIDSTPSGQKKTVGEDNYKWISEFLQEHRPHSVYADDEDDE